MSANAFGSHIATKCGSSYVTAFLPLRFLCISQVKHKKLLPMLLAFASGGNTIFPLRKVHDV